MTRYAAALLLVGVLGCSSSSSAPSEREARADRSEEAEAGPPNGQRVTLAIDGMVCGGCADAVREAIEGLEGSISAEIDVRAGTAVVRFDPTKASVDDLAAAIESVDRDPAPAFRVTGRQPD